MAVTSQKKSSSRTSVASGQKNTKKKTTTTKASDNHSKGTRQSSSASGQNGGKRNASRKTSTQKVHPQYESFLGPEITLLVAFALCLFLFLSNLGMCGAIGAAMHRFLVGAFGVLGYVFPVGLFVAVLFYQANRDNGKAVAKMAAAVGVFLVCCGLASLLATRTFDETITIGGYYTQAMGSFSGGAVGGILLKLLCPSIGLIGGYVVTILLITIGLVFITEKSVIQPISKGSKKVYDTAREDVARRKEEYAVKAEEKRRIRLEQKVSGVSMDTTIGDGTAEAAASDVCAPAAPAPESQPIPISGLGYDPQPEPIVVSEPEESPVIPVSGDVLIPKKDTRTLGELEALDSLHGNVFSQTRDKLIWKEPEEEKNPTKLPTDAGVQMHLRDVKTVEPVRSLDSMESSVDWEKEVAASVNSLLAAEEEAWEAPMDSLDLAEAQAEGYEPMPWDDVEDTLSAPTIHIERSGSGVIYDAVETEDTFADVKRVTTSSGKVVEVELDPDDDPLTRKRIQRRLQEQAAKEGRLDQGTRGSQGDTVSLAGANGLGHYSRPEPETKKKLVPNWNDEELGQTSNHTSVPYSGGDRRLQTGGKQVAGQQTLGQYGAGTQATQYGDSAQIAAQAKRPPKPYQMPPMNLMKAGENKKRNSDRELRETARKLETTLQSFGVNVTVTNISCGPTVTRYELQPEQGVRVSKIVGLSDDIKLNLAAADIRIEAPIPGKASVGIEVPNKENATVYLRDVLESDAFKNHPSKMAFSVGQDISGGMVVTDLAKMPHLLIAGATGSGKSVCINTLIMSILYKAKPEEVRLIMVDPKVVELSVYNGIPHLMIPVVTDPKKAAGALNWAVAEMTDRYRKFADWNVRDLKGYNEKVKNEAEKNGEPFTALPQIVIIVDELADLMMVAPGEVEDAICRLAQMARAAGIHLVIATQRPSVNVITGLIKANVPSRIAFSVSSGVDSRTILDMHGAEKLLGKGDMLFYPSGYQKPVRVQGAFVSDAEVAAVVEFLSKNNQSQTYDSAIEARLASMDNGAAGQNADNNGGGSGSGRDEYFVEAGRFVIEKQKATIGMLQRVFKIGFNRAARIMDQLAEVGVVGEESGTKAREILMDMNQYEQLLQEMGL